MAGESGSNQREKASGQISTSRSASEGGRPYAVVLAEDNPGDIFMVREVLRPLGLVDHLTVFENGEALLDHFRQIEQGKATCPDLLLLDLNLPRVNGASILAQIRQGSRCSQIPVIIVTSSNASVDRAITTALGASDYFRKPNSFDEYTALADLVRQHLRL